MRAEERAEVEQVFAAALPLSTDAREALLATVVSGEVRAEVRARLTRYSSDDSTFSPISTDDAAAPAGELAPGSVLGHFRIERLLGRGGMGEVYLATDLALGRSVALKLLPREFQRDADRVRRFAREARAAASLSHPHIYTVYEVGEADGRSFIATEFVEGESLAARLSRGRCALPEAIRVGREIANALAAAHAAGIVHRDLKPANVMLRVDGSVKVVDFGLAHLLAHAAVTISGTNIGQIVGTPAYMPPEQQAGQPVDARADIYAFGCVLHEMLTGVRPAGRHVPLPSRALERIVNGCLQPEPARRWQSAAEVERLLSDAARGQQGRWLLAGAAMLMIAAAAAASWWYRGTAAAPLTDRDVVVLADFENATADRVFDGTLRQGLAIALEQSAFLKTLDDEIVRTDVRLMQRPPGEPLTREIAHDICVREAAAATIGGSITRLGATYVLTLEAVDCRTGRTLGRTQAQAADKDHVLQALSGAASEMRRKLGESLASIDRTNLPLDQFTTPSLEALQTYALGYAQQVQGQFLPAIPFFKRATELDPNFAMAHFVLAAAYSNAGDTVQSYAYQANAFRLVDRVSEFERLLISARYYWLGTGELQRALDTFRVLTVKYPRYWGARNELSFLYRSIGDYDKAIQEGKEAVRLAPRAEPVYRNLASAYIRSQRMDEARRVLTAARGVGLDGPRLHQRLLEIGYIDSDTAAIEQEIQWFSGKTTEYFSLAAQAADADAHGRRRRGRELYTRAADSARRSSLRNVAAELDEASNLADAIVGECGSAHSKSQSPLIAAFCGEGGRAERMAAESSQRYAHGDVWNSVELPVIRSAAAITGGQPEKVIGLLAGAAPYERAYPEAAYLRGLAYLALGRGTDAAQAFRQVLESKGTAWDLDYASTGLARPLMHSLAGAGLARASMMSGDTVTATNAGEQFRSIWRDADAVPPALLALPKR